MVKCQRIDLLRGICNISGVVVCIPILMTSCNAGLGVALLEGTKIRAAQSKIARAQDICTTQLGSKHPLTEQAGGLLERCKQTLVSKKSMESL